MARRHEDLPIIGWREWVGLPSLGVRQLKAKVDTGARSCALHAIGMEEFERDSELWIRFEVHPLQRKSTRVVAAEARILDHRSVRSSSGATELRPVIETELRLMDTLWTIELTLTRRDQMGFRMLLGRQAFRGRYLIDVGQSYLGGRQPAWKSKTSKKKKNKKNKKSAPPADTQDNL